MKNTLDWNEWGNFLIRLGYFTAALNDPRVRAKLVEEGATNQEITDAYNAIIKMADCFYVIKAKKT